MSLFPEKKVYRDTSVEMKVVEDFNPERYLGLWFELASYPTRFTEDCYASVAQYGLREDGEVSVLNSAHKGSIAGPMTSIQGKAKIVAHAKLNVRFSILDFDPDPDYWVIGLKPDYSMAVVGNDAGTSGWILCRDASCSDEDMAWAHGVLTANGYDLAELRITPHLG